MTTTVFDLGEDRAAKADPALVGNDEQHFVAIATAQAEAVASLAERLAAARRGPGGTGQQAMDRDLEVHRLSARLRTLRRHGLDLCLGRMVQTDATVVYVGRLGLTDRAGRRLLVDWRTPAAEPFFAATHARPMGLVSRRRYRWNGGRITDYWDEVFDPEGLDGHAASLDDQSAFLASLGASRSPRMRDVLGTIAADQDAIIRADARGALVVDGGPGTGKTVVALHRTAYLLHAEPRIGRDRGGVLVVGPSLPYLSYVADVLPSLGEEGVRTCTLRDLVPEGAAAGVESDPVVAGLKARAELVAAIEPAVTLYEEPPTEGLVVETPWGDVWCSPLDWADAFAAPAPGTPHNDGRDEVWEELVTLLAEKVEAEDVEPEEVRRAVARDGGLREAFGRAWPVLEHTDVVGDLWTVPAYLRHCAPSLTSEEVRALQRPVPDAWTVSDLPLLDAARLRLGDPEAARQRRRERAARAVEREEMDRVVQHLVAADDSEMLLMSMLRGHDLQQALASSAGDDRTGIDRLAGPFAHVVIDEAQELTDAEWQMVLARCPSRSLTIAGDRAQARQGFPESWTERSARVGLEHVSVARLTLNYRTPEEVMAAAEPVVRAAVPDANVPRSIRRSGVPVEHGAVAELPEVVASWLAARHEGVACVIAGEGAELPVLPASSRVQVLTPMLAKGLEFDLVVLVEPATFGEGVAGAVDRYVAMTRATQQLVLLSG